MRLARRNVEFLEDRRKVAVIFDERELRLPRADALLERVDHVIRLRGLVVDRRPVEVVGLRERGRDWGRGRERASRAEGRRPRRRGREGTLGGGARRGRRQRIAHWTDAGCYAIGPGFEANVEEYRDWFFAPPPPDNSYSLISKQIAAFKPEEYWRQTKARVLLVYGAHDERSRSTYVAQFAFVLKDQVPNAVVPVNPLGLTITYFREDQAFR